MEEAELGNNCEPYIQIKVSETSTDKEVANLTSESKVKLVANDNKKPVTNQSIQGKFDMNKNETNEEYTNTNMNAVRHVSVLPINMEITDISLSDDMSSCPLCCERHTPIKVKSRMFRHLKQCHGKYVELGSSKSHLCKLECLTKNIGHYHCISCTFVNKCKKVVFRHFSIKHCTVAKLVGDERP